MRLVGQLAQGLTVDADHDELIAVVEGAQSLHQGDAKLSAALQQLLAQLQAKQ